MSSGMHRSPPCLRKVKIVNAGEWRKIIPGLVRQVVYLCTNSIICFDKKIFQDWIVSVPHQISWMQLNTLCLVSEEVQIQLVRHVETSSSRVVTCTYCSGSLCSKVPLSVLRIHISHLDIWQECLLTSRPPFRNIDHISVR